LGERHITTQAGSSPSTSSCATSTARPPLREQRHRHAAQGPDHPRHAPAHFETVPETKERLDITAAPSGKDTLIAVQYGNRTTTVTLTGI